ncbi:MAG: hypothetical protein SPJ27_09025 [Candidatus Onthovivens sp.]|nr:hypothetical protein [Candidatus Onthovivens sp.]
MYIEYHELLKKCKEAEKNYNEALEKKSKLILAVLPGSSKPKEVMVSGGHASLDLKLINYTSEIDQVDNLINQSRNTRDMLNYELKKKLIKMREEGDIYDKIYIYRWIEGRKPKYFYKLIGYSLSRTYDYIDEMKIKLYQNKKSEKIGKN